MSKKQLVYIAHPSGGKDENTKDVENIMRELYKNTKIVKKCCFVSPIHNYGFMYDDVDYETGLSYCLDLLSKCDVMLLCGDWKDSTGCLRELEECKRRMIKIIVIESVAKLKEMIASGEMIKSLTSKKSKKLKKVKAKGGEEKTTP